MVQRNFFSYLLIFAMIAFFVLGYLILRLSKKGLNKVQEDRYLKHRKKWISPGAKVLSGIFIIGVILIFVFDYDRSIMIGGYDFFTVVCALEILVLDIFQLSHYLVLHRITKKWF